MVYSLEDSQTCKEKDIYAGNNTGNVIINNAMLSNERLFHLVQFSISYFGKKSYF